MTTEIKSINDLIEELRNISLEFEEDLWFRGQSEFNWQLSPGLLRNPELPSEQVLISRFKQSAAMLISDSIKEDYDWLFLMQHYGVPTRLLDWSESPLVALYFAVIQNNDTDGALWVLKPTELNKIAGIKPANANEKNYIPSFEDELLSNYTVDTVSSNPRNELAPIATIAKRNSARIQAQLGVFTIHHLDQRPVNEFCQKNEVIQFFIPKDVKKTIRNELKLLEINKFTLFPELSSICQLITEK